MISPVLAGHQPSCEPKPTRVFIVHYLDDQLRGMAKDGRSLPVFAKDKEDAVLRIFGWYAAPGSWDGMRCTKYGGDLPLLVEEVAA